MSDNILTNKVTIFSG